MPELQASKECAELVAAWEGLPDGNPTTANLDPYMDPVGIWTIGYGRAQRGDDGHYLIGPADRAEAYAQYPGGITHAEAVAMLQEDLEDTAVRVRKLVAGTATSQSQFDALVSFQFNVGALATSTLLKLHKAGSPVGTLSDAEVTALAKKVRTKTLGPLDTIPKGFVAFSFAKGAFFGGLFCRRLAEWRLYAGDAASDANAYGAKVRTLIK